MAKAHFSIPDEFKDQVAYRNVSDKRSDQEVTEKLTKFSPVTSEKNIWAFWHAGLKSMPGWCQRNVANWVRLCEPSGWAVRVLDSVPNSENYILKYVPASLLNEAFVNGEMDGPYFGPHSADLLRGACLYLHGGVSMDVVRDNER